MDKTSPLILSPDSDWQKWEWAVLARLSGDKKTDLWEAAIEPGSGEPAEWTRAHAILLEMVSDDLKHIGVEARLRAKASDAKPEERNMAKAFYLQLKLQLSQKLQVDASSIRKSWDTLKQGAEESISAFWSRAESIRWKLATIDEKISDATFISKITYALWNATAFKDAIRAIRTSKVPMTAIDAKIQLLAVEELNDQERETETSGRGLYTGGSGGGGSSRPGGGRPGGGDGGGRQAGGGTGNGRQAGRGPKPTDKCNYCGKLGHWMGDCRKFQRENPEGFAAHNARKGRPGAGGGGGQGGNKGGVSASGAGLGAGGVGMAGIAPGSSDLWGMDSCCERHATWDRSALFNYSEEVGPEHNLKDAGGRVHKAAGAGCVNLVLSNGLKLTLNNVSHLPTFKYNLFSIGQALDRGWVEFSRKVNGRKVCTLTHSKTGSSFSSDSWYGVPVFKASLVRGSQLGLPAISGGGEDSKAATDRAEAALRLHEALGHPDNRSVAEALKEGRLEGTQVRPEDMLALGDCEACVKGKQARPPFPESRRKGSFDVAELQHFDLWGPCKVTAKGTYQYLLGATDEASKLPMVYPLKAKSEAAATIKQHINWVQTNTGKVVKIIRFDRGGEFMSSEFQEYLKVERGIKIETTMAHTPQQNGVSERLFGKLFPMIRSQLVSAALPLSLWAEIAQTSAYQLRHRPSRSNPGGATPYEIFFGRKPDVSLMQPVGRVASILGLPSRRSVPAGKIRPVGERGVMVGYSASSKGWRFLMVEGEHKGQIRESRDVRWMGDSADMGGYHSAVGAEEVLRLFPQPTSLVRVTIEDSDGDSDSGDDADDKDSPDDNDGGNGDEGSGGSGGGGSDGGGGSGGGDSGGGSAGDGVESDSSGDGGSAGGSGQQGSPPATRRSGRQRRPPNRWSPALLAADVSPGGKITIQRIFEPRNSREARECPEAAQWLLAEDQEIEQMVKLKVMERVMELPSGMTARGCRIVYKVKYDALGNPIQFKARLVVLGYQQQYGVDFEETYAPTGTATALRALLSISAGRKMFRRQLDIKGAFLNAELDEEIYIQLPAECGGGLYRLRKALYGLKQAPRVWYQKLRATLEQLGFKPSQADAGVFIRVSSNGEVLIVHVDDLLIFGSSAEIVDKLVAEIGAIFEITTSSGADFFIGMEIEQQGNQLMLSQRRYTELVLDRFGMANCSPNATPSENRRLRKEEGQLLDKVGKGLYMEMVGSLLYLSGGTRPDIAWAVGDLCRHMSAPTDVHMVAAKRVLRYLAGTRILGICYTGQPDGQSNLVGYADADFGGDLDTRRSTTGQLFTINGGAVSWKSTLQKTVSLSTQEAEYQASGAAAREALWLRKLLPDLGMPIDQITIYNDNQACLELLNNPIIGGERRKHIDITHHFVRERIHETKELEFKYTPTGQMAADCLTKPVTAEILRRCRDQMGLREAF